MIIAYGRIGASAPTHASCRHIQATVVGNISATCGTYCGNACNAVRSQGRNAIAGGKGLLVTIHRTIRSNRVGTHIVRGANVKAGHRNREGTHTAFDFLEEVLVGRGILMRGPAEAFHDDVGAVIGGHLTAAHGGDGRDKHRLRGGHRD